jgi:hypothetical protein
MAGNVIREDTMSKPLTPAQLREVCEFYSCVGYTLDCILTACTPDENSLIDQMHDDAAAHAARGLYRQLARVEDANPGPAFLG